MGDEDREETRDEDLAMTARPSPEEIERIRRDLEEDRPSRELDRCQAIRDLKTLLAQIGWQAARIEYLKAVLDSLRSRLEMHGEKFVFPMIDEEEIAVIAERPGNAAFDAEGGLRE